VGATTLLALVATAAGELKPVRASGANKLPPELWSWQTWYYIHLTPASGALLLSELAQMQTTATCPFRILHLAEICHGFRNRLMIGLMIALLQLFISWVSGHLRGYGILQGNSYWMLRSNTAYLLDFRS
jgi:hypothetical protein